MERKCGDMIVNLYQIPNYVENNIVIKRAYYADKDELFEFIKKEFPDKKGWVNETEYGLNQNPIQVYVALIKNKIVGFACYDCTAKGYFGPLGVMEKHRKQGIGKQLLLKTLNTMKEMGYGYAIIGWVDGPDEFYFKVANAIYIPNSHPSKTIYSNKLLFNK